MKNVVFTLVDGIWTVDTTCACGEAVTSAFSNQSDELNGNNVQLRCPTVLGSVQSDDVKEIVEVWEVADVSSAVGVAGLYKDAKGNNNTLYVSYSVTVTLTSSFGDTKFETFEFAPIAWNSYAQGGFGSAKNKAAVKDLISISGSVELEFEALAGEVVEYDFVSTVNMWLENRGQSAFDAIGEKLTTATIVFA